MKSVPFAAKDISIRTFTLTVAAVLMGCAQPPAESITAQSKSPLPSEKVMNTNTNRIMARLDGLSGDSDPRLQTLRNRFAQLGMTVMSMGVSPSSKHGLPNSSQFSAFIVVAFDTGKFDIPSALAHVRALETFTYVEADQMLQKR